MLSFNTCGICMFAFDFLCRRENLFKSYIRLKPVFIIFFSFLLILAKFLDI